MIYKILFFKIYLKIFTKSLLFYIYVCVLVCVCISYIYMIYMKYIYSF